MNDDDRIAEFVDRVEECWTSLGMRSTERRRLVSELVADLESAKSAGATAAELVRADVVAFAVEVASADGQSLASRKSRPATWPLIGTAVVGGVVGAAASWYLVYTNMALYRLVLTNVPYPYSVGIGFLHTMALGLALGGMTGAVWLRYRYQPRVVSLALRTAGWAALGGVVSIAPAVALASQMGYRWDSDVVLLVTVLVGACVAAAIYVGHRLRPVTRATRRVRELESVSPS